MADWKSPRVLGMVAVMLVLAIAPSFVIRTVEPFFFGVPLWAWIMFVIHAALLGLVIKLTEALEVVESQRRVDQ